jgi:hypothetical protein
MIYTIERTKITPKQVNRWYTSGLNNSKNRQVRKEWVNYLAKQMIGGKFLPTNTIAIGILNGASYLVNGQHTLGAIVESGKSLDLPVARYKVSNEKELANLLSHYDIGLGRNFADAMSFHGVPDLIKLSKQNTGRLASAIDLISTNFVQSSNKRKVDSTAWIPATVAFAPFYKSLLSEMKDSAIRQDKWRQKGLLSVILTTVAYGPESAVSFWKEVLFADGLRRHQASKRLHEYVKYEYFSRGDGRKTGKMAHHLAKISAYCWNQSLVQRPIKALPITSIVNNPIVIKGTPYATGGAPWGITEAGDFKPWLALPKSN